ncbi:MAG TPA: type I methionyl aminopeptidase [Solirubrobacteraceae bacterium]|nr:type I methionyl aminopeptidase [Solirubrobacteraceae bacterium]
MSIEDENDARGMKRAGAVVAETLRAMRAATAPGVSTAELDDVAARVFRKHGARSAPRVTYDFPGETCISVDEEIVHGIPSRRTRLKRGSLVKLDVSLEVGGYFADAAVTVPVGPTGKTATKLMKATRTAMQAGIAAAVAGRPVSAIGEAVSAEAARHGAQVFPELTGHGIGRKLHEEPTVSNIPTREGDRFLLTPGLVLTVEPMTSLSTNRFVDKGDGWTYLTRDGSPSAHFEHTIVITEDRPLILTA